MFFLTLMCKYYTHSDLQRSIAFKTVLALFILSTLIPLAVSFTKDNIFGGGGLTMGVFYLSIINLIVMIIDKIIDVQWQIKRIYAKIILRFSKFNYTQS